MSTNTEQLRSRTKDLQKRFRRTTKFKNKNHKNERNTKSNLNFEYYLFCCFQENFASSIKETYTSAKVKIGKYFMVAIYSDSKTGYHWLYSNKYACQYVDIPYRYNPWDYSVVFPCDLHNYGKIEWVAGLQSYFAIIYNESGTVFESRT